MVSQVTQDGIASGDEQKQQFSDGEVMEEAGAEPSELERSTKFQILYQDPSQPQIQLARSENEETDDQDVQKPNRHKLPKIRNFEKVMNMKSDIETSYPLSAVIRQQTNTLKRRHRGFFTDRPAVETTWNTPAVVAFGSSVPQPTVPQDTFLTETNGIKRSRRYRAQNTRSAPEGEKHPAPVEQGSMSRSTDAKLTYNNLITDDNTKHKPKLLLQMEAYLARELSVLKLNNRAETSIAKLAVFRECFNFFIENFRTYAPVLSLIKHEYDSMIDILLTKLDTYRKQEFSSLEENDQLKGAIYGTKKQNLLEKQKMQSIIDGLEIKLEEYKQAEKIMYEQIQEMKKTVEEIEEEKQYEHNQSIMMARVVKNTAKEFQDLQKRCVGLEHQLQRYGRLEIEHNNLILKMEHMVDKKELESVSTELESIRGQIDQLQIQNRALKKANTRLQEQLEKAEKEAQEIKYQHQKHNNAFFAEYEKEREALTPRPDWNETVQYFYKELKLEPEGSRTASPTPPSSSNGSKSGTPVSGFFKSEKKKPKSHRPSRELLREVNEYISLLQETIATQQDKLKEQGKALDFLNKAEVVEEYDESKYIVGNGTSPNIPVYLRYHGKLSLKIMTKRDAELMVEEIWDLRNKKFVFSKKNSVFKSLDVRVKLEDFLDKYLTLRYGNLKIKFEMAYAFIHALEKYSWDADCALFLKVLRGDLSEDVYNDQQMVLDKLKQMFMRLDEQEHLSKSNMTGRVNKKFVNTELERFFTAKSDDDIIKLKCNIHLDNADSEVDYAKLFEETRDKTNGQFISAVKEQHYLEVAEYIVDVQEAIWKRDKKQTGHLQLFQIREAIEEVDPLKKKHEVEEYVARGLGHIEDPQVWTRSMEPDKWEELVEIQPFIDNMKKRVMTRTTKKELAQKIYQEKLNKQNPNNSKPPRSDQ